MTSDVTSKVMTELAAEVERLARVIDASTGLLPIVGPTLLEDVSFLLYDDGHYHLAYRERGQVSRDTFATADDLLFAAFGSITQSMAMQATKSLRRDDQDDRRLWFPAQVDLMRRLSPAWGDRQAARQQAVLARHPFDDATLVRARLTGALRKQGYSDAAAWTEACRRYPLPATS